MRKNRWLKGKGFTVSLLICLFSNSAMAQIWTRAQAPYSRHLNGIAIIDQFNSISVGGNPSNDSISSIFRTENSWIHEDINTDQIGPWFNSVTLVSATTGTVVGDAGSIRITDDGGESWDVVPSPINVNLHEVVFTDQTNGYIVGGRSGSDSTQVILATDNGGTSWSVLRNQPGFPLMSIDVFGSGKAIAVGEAGVILKTENAGQNWNVIVPPVVRDFNAVSFVDATTGYIVGGRFTNDSIQTILKTTDGGDNWSVLLDQPGGWLEDIEFVDANNGYAVGDVATVLVTSNAGLNWVPEALPNIESYDRFKKIEFLSTDYGLIVGHWGTIYIFHDSPLPEAQTGQAVVAATETEATLLGTVNTFGSVGTYTFLIDTDPLMSFAGQYFAQSVTSTQAIEVSVNATFLTPEETYYYCIKATSLSGSVFGDTLSFVATALPPAVQTIGAQVQQNETEADFYGTVNTQGYDGTYTFLVDTVAELLNPLPVTASSISSSTAQEVNKLVGPLTPGETYFYCIKATTDAGVSYGDTLSFDAVLPFDQFSMDSVLGEQTLQPSFYGAVNGFLEEAQLYFEYGISSSFDMVVTADPAVVSDGNFHLVTYLFGTPLVTGQYTVRLKAVTQNGIYYSNVLSFNYVSPFFQLSLDSVADTENLQPSFYGSANNFLEEAQLYFEYGIPPLFDTQVTAAPASINDEDFHLVSYTFGAPLAAAQYAVRLKAVTQSNTYYSNSLSFYNGELFSVFETVSATYDIVSGMAYFEGFVDGLVDTAEFFFNYWGPTFGDTVGTPATVGDNLPHTITATIGNLLPDTMYQMSLGMHVNNVFFNGGFVSFYTGISFSSFRTETASDITPTSAILTGFVNDLNYQSELSFEYGETTAFGQTVTANPDQISDQQAHTTVAEVEGLTPNTLYYYRLKGTTSGIDFYGNTRQFYTGPPEIPNWDFQDWESRTVELPDGWNLVEADFERVDLGGGNSALKLNGINACAMGFFTDSEEGFPNFHSVTPFNYRPDSVFINLEYSVDPGDTTYMIVQLDSADVNLSFSFYPIAGNSNQNFVELAYPIEYNGPEIPDHVTLILMTLNPTSEEVVVPNNNYFVVDRIHFGPDAPLIPNAEFDQWFTYTYSDLLGWSYFKFLDGVTGNAADPPIVSPYLYQPPIDMAVQIQNKLTNGHVVQGALQIGNNPFEDAPFPTDRYHEVLTGYLKFDRQGNDTLVLRYSAVEEGEHVGYAELKLVESLPEFTPFEMMIHYYTWPPEMPEPDSGKFTLEIINTDNVSLSKAWLDKLCFDGFYIGPQEPNAMKDLPSSQSAMIYPNPTTGLLNLKGIPLGATVELMDFKGQSVSRFDIRAEDTSADISNLSNGVYLLRVTTPDSHFSQKILLIGGK